MRAEVAIASILAPGLWALQTRSWRRPKLPLRSNRQTKHRVLARPLGRSIAEASDADAARQSSFDGSLHEVGREERRDHSARDWWKRSKIHRSASSKTGSVAVKGGQPSILGQTPHRRALVSGLLDHHAQVLARTPQRPCADALGLGLACDLFGGPWSLRKLL